MAAESVPQEQNDVHFKLPVDDYDKNHKQQNEDDTDSQGKVTRRQRSTCEGIQQQDVFETHWQTVRLNPGGQTYDF